MVVAYKWLFTMTDSGNDYSSEAGSVHVPAL